MVSERIELAKDRLADDAFDESAWARPRRERQLDKVRSAAFGGLSSGGGGGGGTTGRVD